MPFLCMTHEQNFVSVFPVSNSNRTKWGKKKKQLVFTQFVPHNKTKIRKRKRRKKKRFLLINLHPISILLSQIQMLHKFSNQFSGLCYCPTSHRSNRPPPPSPPPPLPLLNLCISILKPLQSQGSSFVRLSFLAPVNVIYICKIKNLNAGTRVSRVTRVAGCGSIGVLLSNSAEMQECGGEERGGYETHGCGGRGVAHGRVPSCQSAQLPAELSTAVIPMCCLLSFHHYSLLSVQSCSLLVSQPARFVAF